MKENGTVYANPFFGGLNEEQALAWSEQLADYDSSQAQLIRSMAEAGEFAGMSREDALNMLEALAKPYNYVPDALSQTKKALIEIFPPQQGRADGDPQQLLDLLG